MPPAVTNDLTQTQEDFGSATSVGPDVVKMTDAKLDPMLAEGGGEPGQEQVQNKQTNFNPFLLSARYRINNPRIRTVLKMDYFKDKNITRPQNWSIPDPFAQSH